jgi:hypothetical protein
VRRHDRPALRIESLKRQIMDRSSSRPLRYRCELSCIADGRRRRPVECLAVIDAM